MDRRNHRYRVPRLVQFIARERSRGIRRAVLGIGLVVAALANAGCAAHDSSAPPWPIEDFAYTEAAVACDHPVASQAGMMMLDLGGNAVDATVAARFCLSVVRPSSCGIGGGGFMVIHLPETEGSPSREVAINFRETCPAGVGPEYFERLDDPLASRYGTHASGVPGTVAGLLHALERYGTLDRATVLEPAIRAATDGFAADAHYLREADELAARMRERADLRLLAEPTWRRQYEEGRVRVGDLVRNPDQAKALRLIAEQGADAFYRGDIAEAIVSTMQETGGTITREDLAAYRVMEVAPLRGRFRDMDIITMPPPSSGGVALLQLFTMVEARLDEIQPMPVNSIAYVHLLAEMMQHAFADRARWLADPAFVEVPVARLLDRRSLDELAWGLSLTWTMSPESYGSQINADLEAEDPRFTPEDHGTSHSSVIDRTGMAVACTETINLSYGSLVTVPGFGFTLNNEMDDFTTMRGRANAYGLRQSDNNLPQPGKQPLSSMSPTIVLRGGRVVAVAGASGGPRIIAATFQCLLNALLHEMSAAEAVATARFHHQWRPSCLRLEVNWPNPETARGLAGYGHAVEMHEDVGVVQLIVVRQGIVRAASDPRKGGMPAGK